jgi:oxygen-independent coproporphyrinogen III oxidase
MKALEVYEMTTVSLYIHIPFCIHKCSYCDFYSIGVGQRAIPASQYVDRLCEEMRAMAVAQRCGGRALASIFFGGGTPSMVAPDLLKKVISTARETFASGPDVEITCEANPETVDLERLEGLLAAGINRLSVGVQSFDPHYLKFLERMHSAQRAESVIRSAHRAGFTNINLDLIYGLPGQDTQHLHSELDRVIALDTTHVSAYQLTVEPQTPLAKMVADGRVTLPADDCTGEMWHLVRTRLAREGYEQYEISNYARPGSWCGHNQHYWQYGDYLGIGAGAVSRIGAHRWRRARHLKRYLTGALVVDDEERLTDGERRFEFGMLALRTTRGLDMQSYRAHFHDDFLARHAAIVARWQTDGLIEEDAGRLVPTQKGLQFHETLVAQL